ncbi:ABC transporter ATP-binding protein [candidate division WOR-3 bacterium]|nr:ABC transporter ATP-binding protein [candidate division WOR-3 bacterium]
MKALEVIDFKKAYGNYEAVKGIDFEVNRGEIFGLIGPNGAGKTTTLRTICTLIKINNGEINVYGNSVKSEAGKVREIISYLPEEAGAYKNMKGIDYLKFVANFFPLKDYNEMVKKGSEISDLGDKLNNKVESYSKGMTRRLLVARALMTDPLLAVLDEPTSGLDVINAQEVRKVILNMKNSDCAVLLSSHNMLEVEYLCDRIALMDNGIIVEIGTPNELMEKYKARNIEEVFTEVIK